jgi:hypothetical protein
VCSNRCDDKPARARNRQSAIPDNLQLQRRVSPSSLQDNGWAASRIARANFYTGAFNHPAFNQSLTPEGQLLAVLTDKSLADAFAMAFFLGHFTIEFQRTDGADIRQYEVSQQVGADVYKKYLACVNAAAAVP